MANEMAKPPGLAPEYGAQFQDAAIVAAYQHRAPYPLETFEILAQLACVRPSILDLGCGTGDLTGGLSGFAASVDAIDLSPPMIAAAEKCALPNVRWAVGAAETAPLEGPYDLITAAESLHWMDWTRLFPRLTSVLAPDGVLAIVARSYVHTEWWDPGFQALIDRHSTNTAYQSYDLVGELCQRGLFSVAGNRRTVPVPFEQSVAHLVEAFHSRNGFSRDRMTADAARGFDAEATSHLASFADGGVLKLGVQANVTWGRPRD
ncbi:MAG: class I SAM-dependent methyltransferase [Kofleriaceae bacterium]